LLTKPEKHGYTGELEGTQEEPSFQPKDVGEPNSSHGTREVLQYQPPILVEPMAKTLPPPPAIDEHTMDEMLFPAVDIHPVIGNGSESQTMRILDGPQALLKKKKKSKGLE
jgi:hypothetical protein